MVVMILEACVGSNSLTVRRDTPSRLASVSCVNPRRARHLRAESRRDVLVVAFADGLSPFDPGAVAVQAGRMMLKEIDRHGSKRQELQLRDDLSGRRSG